MTAPNRETTSPKSPRAKVVEVVPDLEAEQLEDKRLEAAQKEAEQEWEALEAHHGGEGGDGDGVEADQDSRVPALLQMAANQAQNDSNLTEKERQRRSETLVTRADVEGGGGEPGAALRGGSSNGARGEASASGGAKGEQLASLLCKAEQYSMFIRQSQELYLGSPDARASSISRTWAQELDSERAMSRYGGWDYEKR